MNTYTFTMSEEFLTDLRNMLLNPQLKVTGTTMVEGRLAIVGNKTHEDGKVTFWAVAIPFTKEEQSSGLLH